MTNQNVPENVLSRIQKLLALATSPNENEAALAMERAQELLAQHNLSMATLEQSQGKAGVASEGKRTKEKVERSAMFKYQRDLWASLADLNFCVYWNQKLYKNDLYSNHQHYLVGREDNVVTVKLMGEYLEQTMSRLAPFGGGKSLHSWKEGCAARICERLRTKRWEMERASRPTEVSSDSTALVLADVYKKEARGNQVFMYGAETVERWERESEEWRKRAAETTTVVSVIEEAPKAETEKERAKREAREAREHERWRRRRAREHANRDWDAYNQGAEAAENISLDRQVDKAKVRGQI